MGFKIFKVVEVSGGKIMAKILDPLGTFDENIIELDKNYKFTFVKASDLTVETIEEIESNQSVDILFKYKDNF